MKAAVEQLRESFAFSERHACQLMELAVSTFRYQKKREDGTLREQLVSLARERPRYGYRRLHVLLRREGVEVNHKRVWRVYHDAGLSVKRRKRKRLARLGRPLERVTAVNEEWALDFASDRLATGRSLRVLTGHQLEVRYTATSIEGLQGRKRVASHARSSAAYRHTTVPEHMPKSHRRHVEWTLSRLIHWGRYRGLRHRDVIRTTVANMSAIALPLESHAIPSQHRSYAIARASLTT